MLLVLDIGNTETELGLFPLREDGTAAPELAAQWRISTAQKQTADEYGVLIRQLFAMRGLELSAVQRHHRGLGGAAAWSPCCGRCASAISRIKALFIEPGIKTGMPVHYDNPAEVGADRIVNAVAAYEKCRQSCVVVDFGTATTFDAVSARGEYLGGVIAPGIGISAEALFLRTARLPRVDFKRPPHVLGSNTVHSAAVRPLPWIRRPGGWNSGASAGRTWPRPSDRHRRHGSVHRQRLAIPLRNRRRAYLDRPAHHLGSQSPQPQEVNPRAPRAVSRHVPGSRRRFHANLDGLR